MNSLEIIKNAVKKNCPLVDLEEQFEDVEEQLKVLEILKSHLSIGYSKDCILYLKYDNRLDETDHEKDFYVVERWLEK